MPIEDSFHEKV